MISKIVPLLFALLSLSVGARADSASSRADSFRRAFYGAVGEGADLGSTLLLLDMDEVVFSFPHYLGSDDWVSYEKKEMSKNHGEQAVHEYLVRKIVEYGAHSDLDLVDASGLPFVVSAIREAGGHVMGLTARPPEYADLTAEQLKEKGLSFLGLEADDVKLTGLGRHGFGALEKNILTSDLGRETKGDVLEDYLRRLYGQDPSRLKALSRIVFVDDKHHNVESVHRALQRLKSEGLLKKSIEIRTIHYEAGLHPVSPHMARIMERQRLLLERDIANRPGDPSGIKILRNDQVFPLRCEESLAP